MIPNCHEGAVSRIARALCVAAACAGVTAHAGSCMAAEVQWALFDRSCARGTSVLEVPCGDHGVFHFVHIVEPPGCEPIAEGAEVPHLYTVPGHMHWFPANPQVVGDPVMVPGVSPAASPLTGRLASTPGSAAMPSPKPVPQPPPAPRIVVIDFGGVHGSTTSWLIEEITGPSVATSLAILDDPALARLGGVGDFHVLAKVCQIAESVDAGGAPAPRAVNMSFGRGLDEGEPAATPDCDAPTASCQIAQVIGHLRAKGTRFVAASGNHQQLLFPATVSGVLPVGMLELNAFLAAGAVSPAWETPATARGLVPGNGLCLRHWAAPSGSSYASALFTGWLVDVLARRPNLDPLAGDPWEPRWHPDLGCYVLARGAQMFPWCNAKITELFEGLQGANENTCWSITRGSSESLPDPGPPETQPAIPSFPEWTAATSPTPESDPCVPCTGKIAAGSSELQLNVSQAAAMPEGTFLHAVYLRVEDEFLPLTLSPEQLEAFQVGGLSQLVLPDGPASILGAHPPSLWYEMKQDPSDDCTSSAACFWSSTPILLTGD